MRSGRTERHHEEKDERDSEERVVLHDPAVGDDSGTAYEEQRQDNLEARDFVREVFDVLLPLA